MDRDPGGYPNLLITLFGPRNETLIGELNMTGITLPRKDTRSASDDDGVAAASPSSSLARSADYDSRGAAYYICIVILVYALAIASFVVSLARRRNASRDKYRLAHDQMPVDCQQQREQSGRREGCWKQRCSDSAEFPVGMPSSPWSSSSSSSSSSTSSNSGAAGHQRPDDLDEHPKTGLTPSTIAGQQQLDPDEVITLVQVLPYCSKTASNNSEGSKPSGADEGGPYGEDDASTILGQELETEGQQQKRFRWSMGLDGNIWILQVDDAVLVDNNDNNNDNTLSSNALGCQSQLKIDPTGPPSQPFKDTPFVQSCPSSASAVRNPLLASGLNTDQQGSRVDQRGRPKNLSFSPVPKGYRPRGRSTCRERKTRLVHSEEQGLKTTTFPTGNYPCSNTAERVVNFSLLTAREQHCREEYCFLDPEPFCLPPMVSPHLMQKLIHVTSV